MIAVAGDVATRAGQDALLQAVPRVDILVNNNGGPPFRDFREIDREALLAGVVGNMAAPIELVQRVIDPMVRKFGRIVNITSATVKMPLAGLDLSSGARAGLTAFLAGVARSVAAANVTINFLLPGRSTPTGCAPPGGAKKQGVRSKRRAARARTIPAGRFGEAAEFGAACAFLCSAQAGYITGQSLLIDGGVFPGGFLTPAAVARCPGRGAARSLAAVHRCIRDPARRKKELGSRPRRRSPGT